MGGRTSPESSGEGHDGAAVHHSSTGRTTGRCSEYPHRVGETSRGSTLPGGTFTNAAGGLGEETMTTMVGGRVTRATAGFELLPSRDRSAMLTIDVATSAPSGVEALGVPVATDGPIPDEIGVDRALLLESGFTGALGQTLPLPRGARPVVVAIGVGDPGTLDAAGLRDAAAAFARAAVRDGRLATTLGDVLDIDAETAGQAIVEGVLLARYRYRAFVDRQSEAPLTALTVIGRDDRTAGLSAGVARGRVTAEAVQIARDLANTPATHLTATRMAEIALVLAAEFGLEVEVFDQAGPRRAGLRRSPRRQRGQRRAAAADQADLHAAGSGSTATRPATSRSSARGSCTTPAASASSRRTRCTRR